jgi:hypothetical protein
VKNIKETNTVKNVSKKFGPIIQVTEHKATLLSGDRRTPHEFHDDLQLPTHEAICTDNRNQASTKPHNIKKMFEFWATNF